MWKNARKKLSSLTVQIFFAIMAIVLVTASAAGLPAILNLRSQLERQAWAQIDQASRASEALYAARQTQVSDLAVLMAQRPTLQRLIEAEDKGTLATYLSQLQAGTGLDFVLICDSDRIPLARVGLVPDAQLCSTEDLASLDHLWMMARAPVVGAEVVVGAQLDNDFASSMRVQTGLEHTFFHDGTPSASSLGGVRLALGSINGARGTFELNADRYYYSRLELPEPALDVELALPVTEMVATQRHLVWALLAGILAVAIFSTFFGVLLARRIVQPLARLVDAATALRNGDLARPVVVNSAVQEVALLARALEGARVDLRDTLAELRHEKAWTDHLLEAIVEGIVTLDRHGRITFFSHGAERITGWSRQEVLGMVCDQVFESAEMDNPFSKFIPAPGQRRKISVKLRNDHHAILAVTGARLTPAGNSDARVALVFRDVSEEEAIRRLVAHFLANVSHEFRTPLSALAASVELLMDQAPDLTPHELEELLITLHLGVLGLQTLVDNLLESASIEAGRFRVSARPSLIGEIIAEAIGMMQPLLDKHGQRLIVELPAEMPKVSADPRRMVQVLINLLSNANKYGPDNSEITIQVSVQGDWARVEVTDQGVGILPEQRANLFRRFVRQERANHNAQYGMGLGLSVVKAIVEGHGGSVGVDRAVFWFTLPLESRGLVLDLKAKQDHGEQK